MHKSSSRANLKSSRKKSKSKSRKSRIEAANISEVKDDAAEELMM
jgi:hypothetical protein